MTPAEFLAFWFAGCVGDIHLAAIDPERKFKLISTSFRQPYDFQGMEDWARLYNKLGRNVYFETCTHRPGSPSRGKEETAYEMPVLFRQADNYKDVTRDALNSAPV